MCEKLGCQLDVDNIHMVIIITEIGQERQMLTDLAQLSVKDEVGRARRHDHMVEQPGHHREARNREDEKG